MYIHICILNYFLEIEEPIPFKRSCLAIKSNLRTYIWTCLYHSSA